MATTPIPPSEPAARRVTRRLLAVLGQFMAAVVADGVAQYLLDRLA